ncbi:CHAT domain-containing protein [Streptomyces sp. NPDC001852]|uniref:CHAT domain-containing protein n=1 Tax=unclassified Streptomyces TaxID=2593676 RepID=UPI0033171DF7
MPRDADIEITHNPSHDYTELPGDHGGEPLDLTVTLWVVNDKVIVFAAPAGRRTPHTRTHHAVLSASPDEIGELAAWLRGEWQSRIVGRWDPGSCSYPLADATDLRMHATTVDHEIAQLARSGRHALDTVFAGNDPDLVSFREFLFGELARDGLRVSFDSQLFLPWPLFAVRTDGSPWTSFLGHRHQIEQTGASYPSPQQRRPARPRPVTSLNHDKALDGVGRAADVHQLLAAESELVVRSSSEELLAALDRPDFGEDLMYFWCHGAFEGHDPSRPSLVIRLSDSLPISAHTVHLARGEHRGRDRLEFRPFVLLNACHSGQAADSPGREYLGRALIEHGAHGVLGPQIAIPQLFAAEYAHAFLGRYLRGRETAGEIARSLVHHFHDTLHNPLALTYSLHCGIDSRLETPPCTSPPLTSTSREGSGRPAAVIPSQATGSRSTSHDTSASRPR